MKLAEALALRADLQTRAAALNARIDANARYQEGEAPAEDANALLTEAEGVYDRLVALIADINRTNAQTRLPDGTTMTAALAQRDVLRLRHAMFTRAAAAASGQSGLRQMRSELRQLSALDVPSVRRRADDLAQQLRELDSRIQETNWTIDLVDGGASGRSNG